MITSIYYKYLSGGLASFLFFLDHSTEAPAVLLRCSKSNSIKGMLTETRSCFISFLLQDWALSSRSSDDPIDFLSPDIFLACQAGSRDHVDKHNWNCKEKPYSTKLFYAGYPGSNSPWWWLESAVPGGTVHWQHPLWGQQSAWPSVGWRPQLCSWGS